MSDTPGPWRRIDGEHFQRCGAYGARVWKRRGDVYRWIIYGPADPSAVVQALQGSSAFTLAAAKRAATAALIRHAPLPF